MAGHPIALLGLTTLLELTTLTLTLTLTRTLTLTLTLIGGWCRGADWDASCLRASQLGNTTRSGLGLGLNPARLSLLAAQSGIPDGHHGNRA